MEKIKNSTEEKIVKFAGYLSETLEYYKRLAIQNIQEDKKSEKVDITKNVYLDLYNRYNYMFRDELTNIMVQEVKDYDE